MDFWDDVFIRRFSDEVLDEIRPLLFNALGDFSFFHDIENEFKSKFGDCA